MLLSAFAVCMFLIAFDIFLTAGHNAILAGHSESLPYMLNVVMSETV